MKPALLFALISMSTAAAFSAFAQTYQYKDSSGRTVISDTPPPASMRGAKAIGTSPPPSIGTPQSGEAAKPGEAAKTGTEPKTTAEKDMEFRKRQQEAREKADKEAKEASQASLMRENCERARTHLQALDSGRRMILPDGKGGETFLEDAQRGEEIERARKTIAEACK